MNALESLPFILPECILAVGAFAVLMLDLFVRNKKGVGLLALASLILALVTVRMPESPQELFFGFFYLDSLTHFFRIASIAIVAIVILISLSYKSFSTNSEGEYYSLLLFLALALVLMSSSTNFLMIFLAVEFVSILSYILVGFLKQDGLSKEASIKYLLFGSLASGIMLYGMSLIFGATGSLDLMTIGRTLNGAVGINTISLIGLIFMIAGMGFKISMAPFHSWAPDVYQAAPTPVTALLTVAPKALGFALFIRVFSLGFLEFAGKWALIISWLAIITMTLGNFIAIAQNNIKRLLAYSSIAQAGYILMGIAVFNPVGIKAVLVYLLAYAFTNLGAFTIVLIAEQNTNENSLESFSGLSQRSPLLAAAMMIFLLSLAGIPPLAGFIGKYMVFSSAIQGGFITLAIAAAVNSAVAAFYYFRIVRAMYLVPAKSEAAFEVAPSLRFALAVLFAGTVLVGLFPQPIMAFVESVASSVM